MKSLFFLMMSFISLQTLASQDLIQRIDLEVDRLQSLSESKAAEAKTEAPLPMPFWSAVQDTYILLQNADRKERFIFLYNATLAYSAANQKSALEHWLKEEDNRAYRMGLSYEFYRQWKKQIASIMAGIKSINHDQTADEAAPASYQSTISLLKELKAQAQSPLAPVQPVAQNKEPAKVVADPFVEKLLQALSMALLALFSGYMLYKKYQQDHSAEKDEQTVPSLDLLPPVPVTYLPVYELDHHHPAEVKLMAAPLMLEEECQNTINQLKHLFDLAEVKVHPPLRSPFDTSIAIEQEKMREALEWLIKGTLAIANSAALKSTHLEWSCHQMTGRVAIELTLHGVECDATNLYFNTLTDGEGSAPAHFGRSEMTLNGYYPTVKIKSGSKKTSVNFAMDTIQNSSLFS